MNSATKFVAEFEWGFEIDWLADRGMVRLSQFRFAEITPIVYPNGTIVGIAVLVTFYDSGLTTKRSEFHFRDYLERQLLFLSGSHNWQPNMPESTAPLCNGIRKWLDWHRLDEIDRKRAYLPW